MTRVAAAALFAIGATVAVGWLGSPAVAIASDDSQARFDFVLNCSGCHGTDARGSATVPALDQTAALLSSPEGRAYLVRVPGVAQAPLSDERLAHLMNFVLAEFGGGRAFTPFAAEEVAAFRADPLRAPLSARPK